jgi:hypothetical protein
VRGHSFENLIALCPTGHTRYDSGDIDRLSVKGYKSNIGLVSARYGETERRVLDYFARNPHAIGIRLPGEWGILLLYLLEDGIIAKSDPLITVNGVVPMPEEFMITPAGHEFIKRWVAAEPVSPEAVSA